MEFFEGKSNIKDSPAISQGRVAAEHIDLHVRQAVSACHFHLSYRKDRLLPTHSS
jgi:hypothetical protein